MAVDSDRTNSLRLAHRNPAGPLDLVVDPPHRRDLFGQRETDHFGRRLHRSRPGPQLADIGVAGFPLRPDRQASEPDRRADQEPRLRGIEAAPGKLAVEFLDELLVGLPGHVGVDLDPLDPGRRELGTPVPGAQFMHDPVPDHGFTPEE